MLLEIKHLKAFMDGLFTTKIAAKNRYFYSFIFPHIFPYNFILFLLTFILVFELSLETWHSWVLAKTCAMVSLALPKLSNFSNKYSRITPREIWFESAIWCWFLIDWQQNNTQSISMYIHILKSIYIHNTRNTYMYILGAVLHYVWF